MTNNLREQIIEEAAARIDAASTYEEQVCEYQHAVAELMLLAPYLEILSNPEKYFIPGAKVNVTLGGYALFGEPSPTGIGTILEVRDIEYPAATVHCYLVRFDDPDRWSSVNFSDWKRFEKEWGNGQYEDRVEELKAQYGTESVWDRCRKDLFVKCPQQWVPHNYADFHTLAPSMEWPDHVIS